MDQDACGEQTYDKVTQASLNGIYVKAQELDRGHNEQPAPSASPPGSPSADLTTHASDFDAEVHASDGEGRVTAQAHEDDSAALPGDGFAHVNDSEAHASDARMRAGDAETHASGL